MISGGAETPRRAKRSAAALLRHWACPVGSLILAGAVLTLIGPSPLGVVLLIILLACPVSIAWTLIAAHRPLDYPLGLVPVTEGRTLGWLAPFYDIVCRAFGLGSRFRRRTIDLGRLRRGEHALDAGCGTGALTRLAADAVGPSGLAVGIDAAPDMIRVAHEKAASARSHARFKLAAVEHLPFGDERFDVAFVSLVLHHLPADLARSALREIHRVLKPGGRIVVVDLDPAASRLGGVLSRLHDARPSAMRRVGCVPGLLHDAGFAPVLPLGRYGPALGFWSAFKQAKDPPHA